MASAVPKSRPRQSMAPTVAPLQHQQQSPPFQADHYAFPSPNAQPYDHSPASYTFTGPVCRYINGAHFQQLLDRINVGLQRSTQEEEKRAVIDANFDALESDVHGEIRRLKAELFTSHGLRPSPNKRPPDDDPSSNYSSPDAKRPKADDEDDEVNARGSWRCLYYENDPDSNFHCKGKRYKRVSELRRHIKTHTLPHYCKDCGYRTAEERRLQNHKCEPGNKKRYSPVTEEDRLKHEQLARMGIKVGQMRLILFGKKSDNEEDNIADDDSINSEGPSRRQSFSDSQQPQHLPTFVPVSFPGFQNPILTSQAPLDGVTLSPSAPMYIVPHLPQMPHIAHTQYVVPHGLHHPHPTPPFHPGSAPHSPIMQPGHNHSYYNSDYHQESNDFVLYDNNGTVTSSPSHHQQSPPPNNYQLYTMPGQSPGYTIYSPPPGMPQRQDSLGNYLSTVFPETNGGGLDNFEGGVTARAMPAELIAEMEENLRRQGRTDTKLGVAEKSKNFFRSLSSRSLGKPDGSESSGAERKMSFWKRRTASAPAELGNRKTEEHGILGGIKKIFWIGVGRKRPTRVEEARADTAAPTAAPAAAATPAEGAPAPSLPAPSLPAPVVLAATAEETPAATTTPAAPAPTKQPAATSSTVPAEEVITPAMAAPVVTLPMVQATA
ncbi:hypothetical protein BZA05DRAFT_469913 [Tricharina praecox]|uniref:uncharacterized protein n=1 Tax=Tricharina praecox TaxID=43433 RepID=UPI00221F71E0|nr:uncharacterized protein BZA05DRAFT_469913 [Tricharina praecox]KAI5858647.1 hypothetical protein BZA05DRAFT_469913 [Tricharina praecox]